MSYVTAHDAIDTIESFTQCRLVSPGTIHPLDAVTIAAALSDEDEAQGDERLSLEKLTETLEEEKHELSEALDEARADLKIANEDKQALLAACEQFVRYALNGNHKGWATYLNTRAGQKMLAVIAQANTP